MTTISRPGGISRRTFLQVSAAGVVTATALGRPSVASAEAYSKFTWISPRGTLEVLDDYPYWIGKKMGYFSDLGIETDMQPGPSDGTATVKSVDVGQAVDLAPLEPATAAEHGMVATERDQLPGEPQQILVQGVPEALGHVQRGLHQRVAGTGAHGLRVRRRAGEQPERLGQHGLAGACLARDRGEPRRRLELRAPDHDQVPDLQRPDHGLPNFSR